MILSSALLLAAAQNLTPFMDEEAAARALEAHMVCLGTAAYDRRNDDRETMAVATEVISVCSAEASALRAALTDVYRRKPQLLPVDKGPEESADLFVRAMNERAEPVIREGREHRQ